LFSAHAVFQHSNQLGYLTKWDMNFMKVENNTTPYILTLEVAKEQNLKPEQH
jgi:hypothetical protein